MTSKAKIFNLAHDTIKLPVRFDKEWWFIWDAEDRMVAQVRWRGWIQKLDRPEERQDAVLETIVAAINSFVRHPL